VIAFRRGRNIIRIEISVPVPCRNSTIHPMRMSVVVSGAAVMNRSWPPVSRLLIRTRRIFVPSGPLHGVLHLRLRAPPSACSCAERAGPTMADRLRIDPPPNTRSLGCVNAGDRNSRALQFPTPTSSLAAAFVFRLSVECCSIANAVYFRTLRLKHFGIV